MESSNTISERLQAVVNRAWRFAHPFSRRFLQPDGNFAAVTRQTMSLHLPCGRMTNRNVPLVLTDGHANIGAEAISIRDASFLVNLDFVLLDDVLFLGPMIYQYYVEEPNGLEQAERFFDWIEECDRAQLLACVLANFEIDVTSVSRVADCVPKEVQNPQAWWAERCRYFLKQYCDEHLPEGDDEARELARAFADVNDEDLLREWLSSSKPGVSHFLDLTQIDSLGEFEVVIDRTRLDELYRLAG